MQRLRSRAQFPAEFVSIEVKALGRRADDPTELPPFGLNFAEELLPPKGNGSSMRRLQTRDNPSSLVMTNDEIRIHGIQRYEVSVPDIKAIRASLPLRCTSGAKNSRKDIVLINHVRSLLLSKMD
jgi:hypothetical protein